MRSAVKWAVGLYLLFAVIGRFVEGMGAEAARFAQRECRGAVTLLRFVSISLLYATG